MQCVACRQGFFWECVSNCVGSPVETSIDSENDSISELIDSSTGGPVREINTHNDHNLKDQQSTGRKRAAEMYPLNREGACEWRLKKNCGGGNKPIVGCLSGKQQARHHGPDKNTLNNEEGNVHRICHTCHNRWHTDNDPVYVQGALQIEHRPVEAAPMECLESDVSWSSRSLVKAKD